MIILYRTFLAMLVFVSADLCAQDHLWGIALDSGSSTFFHIARDGNDFTRMFRTGSGFPAGEAPVSISSAPDGTLFGISRSASGRGVLFRVTANGILRICELPASVAASSAGVVPGKDGFVYGMGKGSATYEGYFFRVRPAGTGFESFTVTIYGLNPTAQLLKGSDGAMYGMSEAGGQFGGGFAFRINDEFSGIDIIHHFQGVTGKRPHGGLAEGPDGALYGMTNSGGTNNLGVVFRLARDGSSYTALHHFNNYNGAYPKGTPVVKGEYCYGMTGRGGGSRKGVIFRLGLKDRRYDILHSFDGATGEFPQGSLYLSSDERLYAVAGGGEFGRGAIVSVDRNGGAFRVVHHVREGAISPALVVPSATTSPTVALVSPAPGSTDAPVGGTFRSREIKGAIWYTLELSLTGDFSGERLTYSGNSRDFAVPALKFGTTYFARIKTSVWPGYGPVTTFATKSFADYAFVAQPADGSSGHSPLSLKVVANAVPGAAAYHLELSTTSDFSANTLSKTTTPGMRSVVFNDLTYGTTYFARVRTDSSGTWGKVTRFSTEAGAPVRIAYPLNGEDQVDASLVGVALDPAPGATRYSVSISTSPDFSSDVVVREGLYDGQREFALRGLAPSTTYYVRAKANNSASFGPAVAFTTRAPIPRKHLWGLTRFGGEHNEGTVFSVSLADGAHTAHVHYDHPDDYIFLSGNLARTPHGFAAVSVADGTGGGEVLSVSRDGAASVLLSYGAHDGSVMLGSDNQLYVVDDWINLFRGGIYRIPAAAPDAGGVDAVVFRFRSDAQGANPRAQLVELPDGYLYGSAPRQGAFDHGTIFRVRLDGSAFQVLHSFAGTDGSAPDCSLAAGADGFLYGVTPSGGNFGHGVVFRLRPDGSSFAVLHNFRGSDGSAPVSGILINGQDLFGVARSGGNSGRGVVFALGSSGGGFRALHHFAGSDGEAPVGGLTAGDGNEVYGTTSQGGTAGKGTIFAIGADGAGFRTIHHFNGNNGAFPDGTMLMVEDEVPSAVAAAAESAEQIVTGAAAIGVYPNPFTTTFTVVPAGEQASPARCIVSDMNGNTLFEADAGDALELGADLPRGMYVLRIVRGDEVITQRLVKR